MENATDEIIVNPNLVEIEIKLEPYIEYTNDSTLQESECNDAQGSSEATHTVDEVNRSKDTLPCPICNRTLKNRRNLRKHMATLHIEESENVCTQCFRLFTSKECLLTHIRDEHTPKVINEFNCSECNKVCHNKRQLFDHVNSKHTDINPMQCPKCDGVYRGKRGLRIHLKNVHPYEEDLQCPQCEEIFKTDRLLKKHVINSHVTDDIEFKCPCDTIFKSYIQYKKHMDNLHSINRPRCIMCGQAFKTIPIAKKHLRVNHGLKGDLNEYITYNIVTEPIIKQDPVLITCDACFKTFDNKVVFNRHMRNAHPPKEAAESCDICHKMFKSLIHVRIHKISVHSIQGKLACDECDRVFATKKYLVRHKRTHEDDKQVQCKVCYKFSKNEALLKRHLRTVHAKTICGI